MKDPLVGIIMGSASDIPVMEDAIRVLEKFDVAFEVRVLSAHRTPDEASEYIKGLADRGIKVLIAGAGWAAHLAGAAAANTTIPVIGVPIDSSPLKGMDSLLATVQMPPGIPVATMAIGKGGAYNAAVFAVQILSLLDSELALRFAAFKKKMAEEIINNKNRELQEYLANRKTAE
ncbi:MAG: 5-(carboxyamino)imidazole ribonucleotide mutase [Syntrophobacteraceae bacterium]